MDYVSGAAEWASGAVSGVVGYVWGSSEPEAFDIVKLVRMIDTCKIRSAHYKNKKLSEIKFEKVNVAQLLREDKHEAVRIKVESIIHDENFLQAMDLMVPLLDLLRARKYMLEQMTTCPYDIIEPVSTIVYAAKYFEVEDYQHMRTQFELKYGKDFIEKCSRDYELSVNEQVKSLLNNKPNYSTLVKYIRLIAEENVVQLNPERYPSDEQRKPSRESDHSVHEFHEVNHSVYPVSSNAPTEYDLSIPTYPNTIPYASYPVVTEDTPYVPHTYHLYQHLQTPYQPPPPTAPHMLSPVEHQREMNIIEPQTSFSHTLNDNIESGNDANKNVKSNTELLNSLEERLARVKTTLNTPVQPHHEDDDALLNEMTQDDGLSGYLSDDDDLHIEQSGSIQHEPMNISHHNVELPQTNTVTSEEEIPISNIPDYDIVDNNEQKQITFMQQENVHMVESDDGFDYKKEKQDAASLFDQLQQQHVTYEEIDSSTLQPSPVTPPPVIAKVDKDDLFDSLLSKHFE